MRYDGLLEDFNNLRQTQAYAVGKVVDEAQNYIEYLEAKEDMLEKMIAYLNENANNEKITKDQLLDGFGNFLVETK